MRYDEYGFFCNDRVHAQERRGSSPQDVGGDADALTAVHLHQMSNLRNVRNDDQPGADDSQPMFCQVMLLMWLKLNLYE